LVDGAAVNNFGLVLTTEILTVSYVPGAWHLGFTCSKFEAKFKRIESSSESPGPAVILLPTWEAQPASKG
jgi:hypothetical protein